MTSNRNYLIEAIKFMYWQSTGSNLPIFVVPNKELKKYHTTKQLAAKGIYQDVPEEFRKYEQDVYSENIIQFNRK